MAENNKQVLSDDEVKEIARYANRVNDFELVVANLDTALGDFMLNDVLGRNARALVKVSRFRQWLNKFSKDNEPKI